MKKEKLIIFFVIFGLVGYMMVEIFYWQSTEEVNQRIEDKMNGSHFVGKIWGIERRDSCTYLLRMYTKEGNRGFGYIKYSGVPKMEIGDSIIKLAHEMKIRKISSYEVLGEWSDE